MPKKFKGENSKAAAARDRKEAAKQEEAARKQKAAEDAFWADDDKHVMKKQQRKDDKEKKRLEQLEHKRELAKLAETEMDTVKSAKPKAPAKVTRAQIAEREERLEAEARREREKEERMMHHEVALEENINRLAPDGDEARSVEQAIDVLSVRDPEVEKHPEKRVKAAYLKFEEDNLPRLKQENPNMRLSQLKQLLKKDWIKSPLNPLNQRYQEYNAKR